MDLFNAAESRRLKDKGMEIVASYPNDEWLSKARSVAEMLAAKFGETDSDEVQKLCPRPAEIHPNTTGCIFSGKKWKCVGHKHTEKTTGHSREIRIWSLK